MNEDPRATWGLRFLAVGLALVAWFFFSFADRERLIETTIEPIVQYNPPRDHTVLNPVLKVQVRLRGPTSSMARLNPLQVNVVVDLRSAGVGTAEVRLGPGNVTVPQGLEVVSIEPNVLPLQIDQVVSELKPVDAALTGEPAAGAIAQTPEVLPPAVLASGPASRLREIAALTTSPVQLDGHALDFEEQATVLSPDPLVRVLQPAVVTVRVPLQIPGTEEEGEEEPGP